MEPDTKMVLDAWRKLVVENYRLRLQVAFLRGEIRHEQHVENHKGRVEGGEHRDSRDPLK